MTPAPDEKDEDAENRISRHTLRLMDRALERVEAGEVGDEFNPSGREVLDADGE